MTGSIKHIILVTTIVLPMLCSCRTISSFLHDGDVVAEAGDSKLYKSDLESVIPKGLSAEDSTRLALQYINAWASDRVFLSIAEQQLPKAEKDVTKELEDYRMSLLKYRYEQLYVNQRLDTTVTDEMMEEYYNAHIANFTLDRPVLKARYLRILSDSPVLEPIRRKMSSDSPDDLAAADSLAFTSALKFTSWDNRWIDVNELAREFATDWKTLLSRSSGNWVKQVDTTGVVHLAYIADTVPEGSPAPFEFSTEKIKDIILSSRKQSLINGLERDLLKDARDNGTFVIY